MIIRKISSREVLDSRGNPTVATTVELDDGTVAEASVPSGASTGVHEATELRDKKKSRFMGMGVLSAVHNVENIIAPALVGWDAKNQSDIDELLCSLDDTKNKSNLGANAILSVSLAIARTEAISQGKELYEYLGELYWGDKKPKYKLPLPMFNVLNGGKHAENSIDIQEAIIVPAGPKTFNERLRVGSEIYHALKNTLANDGYFTGLGDEGGFAPNLDNNEMIFKYLKKTIEGYGSNLNTIRISIDFASSEIFDRESGKYLLEKGQKSLNASQMVNLLTGWSKKYNLLSIEDGLSEEDPNWKTLTQKISPTITIGDDLFTTDPEKIALGAQEGLAKGVIIKPNQIGTLSETFEAIKNAKKGKLAIVISHRSGETEDSFIADLAVAVNADYIKAGAPARSERLAKYNRLSKIEDELKRKNIERR